MDPKIVFKAGVKVAKTVDHVVCSPKTQAALHALSAAANSKAAKTGDSEAKRKFWKGLHGAVESTGKILEQRRTRNKPKL
jgi:hypothetical protein